MIKRSLVIALSLCLAAAVGFAGGSGEKSKAGGTIGISKIVAHPALDAVRLVWRSHGGGHAGHHPGRGGRVCPG